MKWLAITIVILLVGFVGYWLIELKDRPQGTETAQSDANTLGQAPETKPDQPADPTLVDYSLAHGNLAFKYPGEWTLIEGADNDEQLQIVTIESPKDNEGYYYCVDFNEYGPGQDPDLESANLEVQAVDSITAAGVGKSLSGVIYQTTANQLMIWGLSDMTPSVGDSRLVNSVTNPAGRQLQAFARFNCRDEQLPSIELEQFQNSRLFDESLIIFTNLSY